ncbi:MAG: hypothetical protein AAFY99_06980 [Pseudomonadota bacterium]
MKQNIGNSLFVASVSSALFATLTVAHADQASDFLAMENYIQADVDGDTMLTLDEFTNFIDLNANDGLGRAGMIRDRGMHGFAFRRVDANSDGLIAPDEMSAMAR